MAAAAPPPSPAATAELNMNLRTNYPLFTRIFLAGKPDVSAIHKMIHQMAVFERFSDQCFATEPSLSATLFSNNTPFESVTVFVIEVSTTLFPSPVSHHPKFTPIHKTLNLDRPISDPEMETFKSSKTEDAIIIAGFVLFFPNYSTFLAKPRFYFEDLFVRECYRMKRLGKMMLSAVAKQALAMGYGRDKLNKLIANKKHPQIVSNGRKTTDVDEKKKAAAAPPPLPTATAELNMNLPTNYPLFTRFCLAGKPDVSTIQKMIHQMAVFERFSDQCFATEPSLSATLLSNNTAFESVTVFLIEVSTTLFPSPVSRHPKFTLIHKTLNLDCPISDPEMETFKVYIDDLFVRECYRRKGLGKIMLSAVAKQAVAMGLEGFVRSLVMLFKVTIPNKKHPEIVSNGRKTTDVNENKNGHRSTPTTAELNMNLPTNYPLFTRICLAGKPDVSAIHKMIHQMAVFERFSDQCFATEPSLSATLFSNNTPFESVTVFFIEVSTTLFPSPVSHHPKFTPIHKTLNLDGPISDPEMETIKSSKTEDAIIIAGFVLFFTNYSTFLAKPRFYFEDLFVRECYRMKRLGKMMLSAVAKQAVAMGCGREEWVVWD
ncbi:hypothetical protein E3N88_18696 [Mikania micrantha]|uniref:N-acetyltransferase domain-containing protein n=1 Tax=Mikania micrantha TaxID=192012 RepID=A0A5N6NMV2_9ASTR|nr:hypothetical protein E3N88_18696 [Mikania micrantha]